MSQTPLEKPLNRPYNMHWQPYWLRCAPCSVKYAAVVKVETMEEDFRKLKVLVVKKTKVTMHKYI